MKKIEFFGSKNIIRTCLKNARTRNNITQIALAARLQTLGVNIDQRAISRIERNLRIVTDYELACFCVALRVAPEELLKDFYNDNTT